MKNSEKASNENVDTGEWNSVGRGGKGGKKQKKKLRKSRTVTLQTFITENGGYSPDGMGSSSSDKDEASKSSPDLNDDEQVVRSSLLSFFTDLLRRLGPVKRDE